MDERRVAFDTDVLIYSVVPGHPSGEPVARLLEETATPVALLGSTLLVPELLIKPTRMQSQSERQALIHALSRLTLIPIEVSIAELATALGATYALKPANAIHLATAVDARADQFVTNNRRDFDQNEIVELEVVYPEQLG